MKNIFLAIALWLGARRVKSEPTFKYNPVIRKI
jgi:hypothetical protein